jgi:hypothetical protein
MIEWTGYKSWSRKIWDKNWFGYLLTIRKSLNLSEYRQSSGYVRLDLHHFMVMSPFPIYLFKKKQFHHFDVCTYVLYVFYYLFTTSKDQELLSFF